MCLPMSPPCASIFCPFLPFVHHVHLSGDSYLSWGRLVLGRVVSAGLLVGGCDGPLTLLELLGLRRRHLGLLIINMRSESGCGCFVHTRESNVLCVSKVDDAV